MSRPRRANQLAVYVADDSPTARILKMLAEGHGYTVVDDPNTAAVFVSRLAVPDFERAFVVSTPRRNTAFVLHMPFDAGEFTRSLNIIAGRPAEAGAA